MRKRARLCLDARHVKRLEAHVNSARHLCSAAIAHIDGTQHVKTKKPAHRLCIDKRLHLATALFPLRVVQVIIVRERALVIDDHRMA